MLFFSFYHAIFLLHCFATPIIAFGIRGAAERVLAYYAYLADESSAGPGTDTRTIAVNCVGANGRCNFNEFCIFIDGRPANLKPNFNLLSPSADFLAQNIPQLIQAVDSWKGPKGEKMTGLIDYTKLVSGASNYNEALKGLGDPLGKLAAVAEKLPAGQTKDAWQKIAAGGKLAGKEAYRLRVKDYDRHRIPKVKLMLQNLKPPIKLELEPGPKIASEPGTYQLISRKNTVTQFTQKADQVRADQELRNANSKYNSTPGINNRHYHTIMALKQTQKAIACTKP